MFFSGFFSLPGKKRLMVIRHQYRHAALSRISDFFDCRDAIVAGQDRIYAFLRRIPQQIDIQPISIFHPIRDLIIHYRAAAAQCAVQNIRSIDSINIIVTDNPDFFLFCDFIFQNLCRPGAALQPGRIAKPDK